MKKVAWRIRWWRADRDNWSEEVDDLRAYEVDTSKISTVIDKNSLEAGFKDYQGDERCVSADYYARGVNYAVSPNQQAILLWDDWLYLVIKK